MDLSVIFEFRNGHVWQSGSNYKK